VVAPAWRMRRMRHVEHKALNMLVEYQAAKP
jgi:hypothetical protein